MSFFDFFRRRRRRPSAEPSSVDLVAEFHAALDDPVHRTPIIPGAEEIALRVALIAEEVAELFEEVGAHELARALRAARPRLDKQPHEINFPRLLKELTDTQYVLDGAYLVFGLGPLKARACAEVHRSNMTKTIGRVSVPGVKIGKGPHYEAADMEQFFVDKET